MSALKMRVKQLTWNTTTFWIAWCLLYVATLMIPSDVIRWTVYGLGIWIIGALHWRVLWSVESSWWMAILLFLGGMLATIALFVPVEAQLNALTVVGHFFGIALLSWICMVLAAAL